MTPRGEGCAVISVGLGRSSRVTHREWNGCSLAINVWKCCNIVQNEIVDVSGAFGCLHLSRGGGYPGILRFEVPFAGDVVVVSIYFLLI